MSFSIRRCSCVSLGVILAILLAFPVLAEAGQRINKDSDNVALKGYDTVAYFTEGRPIKGKSEFQHDWRDAEWRFANAEHRDAFASNPEHYAPRYGGFCAAGTALGYVVRVDPEAWVIIDGKLYLNYDKGYADEFAEDAANQIARADANWEKLGKAE